MIRILFTLCGRAGSKGFRNKNLRNFLEYPLAYYSLSAIELYMKHNPAVHVDIVLNTDSQELIRQVLQQDRVLIHVIEREPSLSGDSVPKSAVIADCLKKMESKMNKQYTIVVDLDITSPLRTVQDIELLIKEKIANTFTDVIFSVTPSRRNPYFNMVKKTKTGFERVLQSSFTTRQEAPEIFDMNASLYAYEPSFLIAEKLIFSGTCGIITMRDTGVLDIDSEEDFLLMQVIAQYFYANHADYGHIFKNLSTW